MVKISNYLFSRKCIQFINNLLGFIELPNNSGLVLSTYKVLYWRLFRRFWQKKIVCTKYKKVNKSFDFIDKFIERDCSRLNLINVYV